MLANRFERRGAAAPRQRTGRATAAPAPAPAVLAMQRGAGNRATAARLQRKRIGKIPTVGWLTTHVDASGAYAALAAGHDVADFRAGTRATVLAQNAAYYLANPAGVHAAAAAGGAAAPVSDESGTQLRSSLDASRITPEVDHIIPYNDWGSNDPRNARVISKRENTDPTTGRPSIYRVVALEDDAGAGVQQGDVMSRRAVNTVLTRLGRPNVANVGALTNDDFWAFYRETAAARGPRKRTRV